MFAKKDYAYPYKEVPVKPRPGAARAKAAAAESAARREQELKRWQEVAERSVAHPYAPDTRLHNWQEDLAMRSDHMQRFLDRRDAGQLGVQRSRHLLARLLAPLPPPPLPLPLATPGAVAFGSRVQLVATEVPGPRGGLRLPLGQPPPEGVTLAASADDCLLERALASGGLVPGCPLVCLVEGGPTARSTFEIRDESGGEGRAGEALLLGQPFTLALLGCADTPFFVSTRPTIHSGQEVALCPAEGAGAGARWMAVCAECPALRLELEGQPVGPPAARALAIYNQATGRPLAAAGSWRLSYFGPAMAAKAGLCPDPSDPVAGTLPRKEGARNRWRLVSAAPPPPPEDVARPTAPAVGMSDPADITPALVPAALDCAPPPAPVDPPPAPTPATQSHAPADAASTHPAATPTAAPALATPAPADVSLAPCDLCSSASEPRR